MDNSISINLGDKQSNASLSFHWMAEFKDSVIFQFENGLEHKFQEVIDRFSELKYFHLYHERENINFTVDLTLGLITFNEKAQIRTETKNNIRLIHFRRVTVYLNQNMKDINREIIYFLGYQYIDSNGFNRKVVLQIDSLGNWVLGDN